MSFARAYLTVVLIAGTAQAGEPSWEQRQSVPRWAAASLEREAFSAKYVLSTRLNPFLVQGDFNGDGRIDLAVLVEQRETRASGVAIVHAGAEQPLVVGAGTPLACHRGALRAAGTSSRAQSSGERQGQGCQAAQSQGRAPLRLLRGSVESGEAIDQRADGNRCLAARQGRTQAEVRSVPE